MLYLEESINRLEKDIRQIISNSYSRSNRPIFQHINGRRLFLSEVIDEGVDDAPIIGALSIIYAAGVFLSLDRVVRSNNQFRKQRRIIYYLDSRPGQVGSSLLLELLKLTDGDVFSKHKFIQKIDESYFQSNDINISSGEINEALSRMFRKTLPEFFGVDGRQFKRAPFVLKMEEISVRNPHVDINYDSYKHEIDGQTYQLVKSLNTITV